MEEALLELMNGVWALLELNLLGWFTYYIYMQIKELDYFSWQDALRNWKKHGLPPHINAAVAIYVFSFGDLIVRAHFWIWRHYQGSDMSMTHKSWWYFTPLMIGGSISIIGLLCKIRVFSVYRVGNSAWITSIAEALLVTILFWMLN